MNRIENSSLGDQIRRCLSRASVVTASDRDLMLSNNPVTAQVADPSGNKVETTVPCAVIKF